MENILVESSKKYYHGFILKESDLRRICELIITQFQKISNGIIKQNFTVKFENGTVAQTDLLDTIINLENAGSASIIGLKITTNFENPDNLSRIELEFRNCESPNQSGLHSIQYIISSNNRDWVFVTSSLLDERIKNAKRFSPNQLPFTKSSSGFITSFFLFFTPFITMVIAIIAFKLEKTENYSKNKFEAIQKLQSDWNSGKIKDPTAIYLAIELENVKQESARKSTFFNESPYTYFYWFFGGLFVLMLIISLLIRFYPVYNFCWGDYISIFERKESIRKTIFIVIIIGIAVSIVGNIITHFMIK